MTDFSGELVPIGPIALIVSHYHARVTERLLDGARTACREAGVPDAEVDILRVSGAFELGVVAGACCRSGRYAAVVALGVVVRGETPHFDVVAGEAAAALSGAAARSGIPVGLGLLTCDTMAQAVERAGGSAGNKGHEAAEAAIRTADLLRQAGLA